MLTASLVAAPALATPNVMQEAVAEENERLELLSASLRAPEPFKFSNVYLQRTVDFFSDVTVLCNNKYGCAYGYRISYKTDIDDVSLEDAYFHYGRGNRHHHHNRKPRKKPRRIYVRPSTGFYVGPNGLGIYQTPGYVIPRGRRYNPHCRYYNPNGSCRHYWY